MNASFICLCCLGSLPLRIWPNITFTEDKWIMERNDWDGSGNALYNMIEISIKYLEYFKKFNIRTSSKDLNIVIIV